METVTVRLVEDRIKSSIMWFLRDVLINWEKKDESVHYFLKDKEGDSDKKHTVVIPRGISSIDY
jgi:hypothetical protein